MVVHVPLMHDGRRGEGKDPCHMLLPKASYYPQHGESTEREKKSVLTSTVTSAWIPRQRGRLGEEGGQGKGRLVGRTDGWKGHGQGQARQVEGRSQVHARTDQSKGERVNDKENT